MNIEAQELELGIACTRQSFTYNKAVLGVIEFTPGIEISIRAFSFLDDDEYPFIFRLISVSEPFMNEKWTGVFESIGISMFRNRDYSGLYIELFPLYGLPAFLEKDEELSIAYQFAWGFGFNIPIGKVTIGLCTRWPISAVYDLLIPGLPEYGIRIGYRI